MILVPRLQEGRLLISEQAKELRIVHDAFIAFPYFDASTEPSPRS